jgi:hypothetical protein
VDRPLEILKPEDPPRLYNSTEDDEVEPEEESPRLYNKTEDENDDVIVEPEEEYLPLGVNETDEDRREMPVPIPPPMINGNGKHHWGASWKHKRHYDMMKHPWLDTKKMTCEQACMLVKWFIAVVSCFMFVYASLCVLIVQTIYICCIHKAKTHQETLERQFMAHPVQVAQP